MARRFRIQQTKKLILEKLDTPNINKEFVITSPVALKASIQNQKQLVVFQPCTIQSEFPVQRHKVFYFEIELLGNCNLQLGLGLKDHVGVEVPGIDKNSLGLNVKNRSVSIKGLLKPDIVVPELKAGDFLGLFYNPLQNGGYFAVNGVKCNPFIFAYPSLNIYPTLHAFQPIEVLFNFGISPFNYEFANQPHLGLQSCRLDASSPPQYTEADIV